MDNATIAPEAEVFVLPDKTTLETAEDVLHWAQELDESAAPVIEAGAVETIDGATAIALVGVARHFAGHGVKLAVKEPPSAFVDAYSDLGLFEDLMKMEFR